MFLQFSTGQNVVLRIGKLTNILLIKPKTGYWLSKKSQNNTFQNTQLLLNSSQVKIKYKFSKPFRSKPFSKDGNHAESEQFL